jgi:single-strand DNA-binding protein
MASFNKVILMGNLTRDPEIRFTQSQMAICKIGMAVNRRFKDGQSGEWKEEATFIDVTIFGKRGEAFEKYHKKGEMAFVEGSLRLDTWEDKNSGQKRSKLYVVADNWEFVGGGRGAGAGGGRQGGGYSEQGGGGGGGYADQSAPSGGGGDAGAAAGGGGGGYGAPQPDFLEADDTPF